VFCGQFSTASIQLPTAHQGGIRQFTYAMRERERRTHMAARIHEQKRAGKPSQSSPSINACADGTIDRSIIHLSIELNPLPPPASHCSDLIPPLFVCISLYIPWTSCLSVPGYRAALHLHGSQHMPCQCCFCMRSNTLCYECIQCSVLWCIHTHGFFFVTGRFSNKLTDDNISRPKGVLSIFVNLF
jgi:hypothetical protein